MCATEDSLMLSVYVRYSGQFNADNMCVTADSLMLPIYVRYSGQYNAFSICAVQGTV